MRNRFTSYRTFRIPQALALLAVLSIAPTAMAANPPSLKDTPIPLPDPAKLDIYVKDNAAAIRLGKALFWDMQVGSDAATACATCHHHAGADGRTRNTLHPGANGQFDVSTQGNADIALNDFPFHEMVDRHDRGTGGIDPADPAVLRSRDDIVGAQGVNRTRFLGVNAENALEPGRAIPDDSFRRHGRNVRQSTGRNAPTVINAVFNYSNFLDGRANHFFNGVNPFGIQDVSARVLDDSTGTLLDFDMNDPANRLKNASLASQAVGPVLSDVEMSWIGRDWPDVGRKMLSLRPLSIQDVHPQDSVLGPLVHESGKGLSSTYSDMIQAAFQDRFWNNNTETTAAGFTQIEANFSLYFGLSVMLYEATLVSDDTPFDRFVGSANLPADPFALTEQQQLGLNLFTSGQAQCSVCHIGAEFTGATVATLINPAEAENLIEIMAMGSGIPARYDLGFYNIGVTSTNADPGRGGNDPFGNPLSFSRQSLVKDGLLPGSLSFNLDDVPQPGCVPDLVIFPPTICPPNPAGVNRDAVDGAFKTPSLRNVELTGPYMHNGSMITLAQVIDFYIRGGNFLEANIDNLDIGIAGINGLKGDNKAADREAIVAFFLALTDERVRQERAPFDHPQFFVPEGHQDQIAGNPKRTKSLVDNLKEIPAVGQLGRSAQGLAPLKPVLAPEDMDSATFHSQF